MARHSKGKHAAPKAALKHKAKQQSGASVLDTLEGAPALVPAGKTADEVAAEQASGVQEAAATAASEGTPASTEASTIEAENTDADANVDSKDAKDTSSKESTAKESTAKEDTGSAKHAAEKRIDPRLVKRIAIAVAATLGSLGIMYVAGALLFTFRFFPGTSLSTLDLAFADTAQAAAQLDEKVGAYSFAVRGQGLDIQVTSEQAGVALDSAQVAETILADQNPWTWPVDVFASHDVTSAVAAAMNASSLSDVLNAAITEVNKTANPPVNAAVVFKEDKAAFEIIPEVQGTTLDPEKVLENTLIGVLNLDHEIVLQEDSLLDPTVYAHDERLKKACEQANLLARANVEFTMAGHVATTINAATIGKWVTIAPDFSVDFNDAQLVAWAEEIGSQLNTIGAERTYTRPDGKVVTVKGGTYGWKIDGEALKSSAVAAVKNGTQGQVEVPVLTKGNGFTTAGSQDWGKRYVDVDISEQHARFFDEAGNLVWESDIVSGAKGKNDTPTGVFALVRKQSPTVLIGAMTSEGVPSYESYVKYWMPFQGNMVGLHDASWQSGFGGRRYASGYGSHGCVNLPTGAAGQLYGMLQVGDVVVVHY